MWSPHDFFRFVNVAPCSVQILIRCRLSQCPPCSCSVTSSSEQRRALTVHTPYRPQWTIWWLFFFLKVCNTKSIQKNRRERMMQYFLPDVSASRYPWREETTTWVTCSSDDETERHGWSWSSKRELGSCHKRVILEKLNSCCLSVRL